MSDLDDIHAQPLRKVSFRQAVGHILGWMARHPLQIVPLIREMTKVTWGNGLNRPVEYRAPSGTLPPKEWITRATRYLVRNNPHLKGYLENRGGTWSVYDAQSISQFDVSDFPSLGTNVGKDISVCVSAYIARDPEEAEHIDFDACVRIEFIALVEPHPSGWGNGRLNPVRIFDASVDGTGGTYLDREGEVR